MVASISEAKAKLSALLDRVKAGEIVTLTDRGVPVAQIVPLPKGSEVDWDARMQRLERAGLVRLPTRKLDVDAFLSMPRARTRKSVLEALLQERHESPR